MKVEELKVEIALETESKRTSEIGRETKQEQLENTDIKEYIRSLWGDEAEYAFRIITCESGWNTLVISRTNDVGLWQINLAAHASKIPGGTRAEDIEWLKDWRNNTDFAYFLWLEQGWSPWVCHRLIQSGNSHY